MLQNGVKFILCCALWAPRIRRPLQQHFSLCSAGLSSCSTILPLLDGRDYNGNWRTVASRRTGATAAEHGEDINMVIPCRRSLFRQVPILLLLFLTLAAHSMGDSSATGATSVSPGAFQEAPGIAQPQSGSSPAIPQKQHAHDITEAESESAPPLSQKQRQDIMKANFEKMKHDATELQNLAKSLQEQIDKSNEHILSLDIVAKAERIEKLARRIKETARGL